MLTVTSSGTDNRRVSGSSSVSVSSCVRRWRRRRSFSSCVRGRGRWRWRSSSPTRTDLSNWAATSSNTILTVRTTSSSYIIQKDASKIFSQKAG